MNPPRLITREDELVAIARELAAENHLAVDTETDSFFAYTPRVCLIQLSCNQSDFLVDPLALRDLSPLAPLLSDPKVEKVIHACENDIIGLKRDFDLSVRPVFDTAIACRLLGRKQLALSRILADELGVKSDKKLQRCNWAKRPLSNEQLSYAQYDTHFLIELRHRLHRRLLDLDLWGAAQERFRRLEELRLKPEKPPYPKSYLRLPGAETLSPEGLRVLMALLAYRERLARRSNQAPFRIMTNEVLVRLARELPQDLGSLLRVRGLPRRFAGRSAHELLRLLKEKGAGGRGARLEG
jgi:ribonuclease D